jgi:hypothetical protein
MIFREVFVYKCLSFISAQDLGSQVDFTSDHMLVCRNPVFGVVNLGDLGDVDFWAGLEICCAAMVETQILEIVQCSDLALCCCRAYLFVVVLLHPVHVWLHFWCAIHLGISPMMSVDCAWLCQVTTPLFPSPLLSQGKKFAEISPNV